jgi:hypothetical protein
MKIAHQKGSKTNCKLVRNTEVKPNHKDVISQTDCGKFYRLNNTVPSSNKRHEKGGGLID